MYVRRSSWGGWACALGAWVLESSAWASGGAPTAVITATSARGDCVAPCTTMVAEPGGAIQLWAATSSDPDGDGLTYLWEVAQRPAGSTAEVADPTLVGASFVPDVVGDYQLGLSASDPGGNVGRASLQLLVHTAGFNLVLAVKVGDKVLDCAPTCPTGSILIGTKVVGDATESRHEPSHGPLVFAWFLERPSGSRATIEHVDDKPEVVQVMPDVDGVYELRVSMKDDVDSAEAYASFRIETPANYNLDCSSTSPAAGWWWGLMSLWVLQRRRGPSRSLQPDP